MPNYFRNSVIRIGPAGIPLSCKERTNIDGIIYTRCLGLSAMEIRFSRAFVSEEEARQIKKAAKKSDIEISVHAPYYINLAGDPKLCPQYRALSCKPPNSREIVSPSWKTIPAITNEKLPF